MLFFNRALSVISNANIRLDVRTLRLVSNKQTLPSGGDESLSECARKFFVDLHDSALNLPETEIMNYMP